MADSEVRWYECWRRLVSFPDYEMDFFSRNIRKIKTKIVTPVYSLNGKGPDFVMLTHKAHIYHRVVDRLFTDTFGDSK